MPRGKRQEEQLTLLKPKPSRAERTAGMDEEILDVEGAARALGVSTRTIYSLARKGEIPAMRVGREWRFALRNLREWVANSSKADQLTAVLRNGRVARKRI
jgi:excisionase family DNA binding protein